MHYMGRDAKYCVLTNIAFNGGINEQYTGVALQRINEKKL